MTMEDTGFSPRNDSGEGEGDQASGNGKAMLGIQEVASQLGVTLRALRFYEKEGLIKPERVGTTRVYTKREIGRMQLILRGKRLGFSIREIKEFLDLYDADPNHQEQMERLAERVRERLDELEEQRKALEQTIEELTTIEREARARLQP
ncbi:MerR family transcriptional regulator [Croceicoccus mobilis]|uniref:MerR family transcriptional regulator n=2 Tax=Croceicoccus mobilis TaxID=1703339 RepID=A0A917DXE1_9SPHN|nr:MerR family transcriptional regulator [Croceicoccus mobilis]